MFPPRRPHLARTRESRLSCCGNAPDKILRFGLALGADAKNSTPHSVLTKANAKSLRQALRAKEVTKRQPLENTIGAIALYLIVIVVVTSYFRIRIGRRLWKAFHFSIYLAAAALFFHSLRTDPDLKNAPVHWLDGGKVFVEFCLMLIAGMSLARWRHSRSGSRFSVSRKAAVGS